MQTRFPYYVAPVQSNDEYSDEPTHCAFEVRPSVALLIAWYLVITHLFTRVLSECSETRFYFPNISWMTLVEDDNLLEEEIVESGGFADGDKIGLSFRIEEDGLRGYEIQALQHGYFRLSCYHKHSGVEFFSDEIGVRELFRALRLEYILAESRYFALLRKARATLRRLA